MTSPEIVDTMSHVSDDSISDFVLMVCWALKWISRYVRTLALANEIVHFLWLTSALLKNCHSMLYCTFCSCLWRCCKKQQRLGHRCREVSVDILPDMLIDMNFWICQVGLLAARSRICYFGQGLLNVTFVVTGFLIKTKCASNIFVISNVTRDINLWKHGTHVFFQDVVSNIV